MMQMDILTGNMMDLVVSSEDIEMEEDGLALHKDQKEQVVEDESKETQTLEQHQEQIKQQQELEHQRLLELEQKGKLSQQDLPSYGYQALIALPTHGLMECGALITSECPQKCIMWV